MDASCKIQRSIHVFRLVYKYVSRILGTYQISLFIKRGQTVDVTKWSALFASSYITRAVYN